MGNSSIPGDKGTKEPTVCSENWGLGGLGNETAKGGRSFACQARELVVCWGAGRGSIRSSEGWCMM